MLIDIDMYFNDGANNRCQAILCMLKTYVGQLNEETYEQRQALYNDAYLSENGVGIAISRYEIIDKTITA